VRGSYWPLASGLLVGGGLLAGLGLLLSPRLLGRGMLETLAPLSLGILAVGGVLVLAGAATIVVAQGRPEAARTSYGSHGTVLGLTLLAVLGSLVLVLPFLLPALGSRQPPVAGFLAAAVVQDIALVSVVYFRVVRPGIISWRKMGLGPGGPPGAWWLGLMAAPGLFLLIALVEVGLRSLGVRQTQLESLEWLRSVPLWQFALVAFCTAVLAPIAEEIYFRGYVFRAYLEQKGPLQAYVLSSLLFAVAHLNLPALLPIFAVGLFLALLYHRTGSVVPGIIAHACNNAVAFTVLYFAPYPMGPT
jgi:membrane protease YdiL (CAAX protease family)